MLSREHIESIRSLESFLFGGIPQSLEPVWEHWELPYPRDRSRPPAVRQYIEVAFQGDPQCFFYDGTITATRQDVNSRLIIASREYWDDLICRLARRPQDLRTLSPRKFEELVAEMLQRDGAHVQLTPQTHDGGRDILATYETPVGRHLCLVECKRHSASHPVDISIVRELYGVLAVERASAAMIATTSYFTADALKFRETIQYQMSCRNFEDVKMWLRRIADRE